MWQLFNLLRADDHVEAVTFRKVSWSAGADGAGPGDSERIRVKLRVLVESVDYDGEGEAVRVKGRNTTETEHVKLGAYHTLDLDRAGRCGSRNTSGTAWTSCDFAKPRTPPRTPIWR